MKVEIVILTTEHKITKRLTGKNKESIFLAIMLFAASLLFLANLGNRYLWQDEAETALVSKTILVHGVPLGYDGKNFFSQEGNASYGKDYLWVLDPWLCYYLVAGFFKIFGISTFTARLPFALLGIATTVLTYFFAKSLSKDEKVAAVATVMLILSVPFLILCRQSRYYVLVAFLSLLGLYGYLMLLKKSRGGSIIFLIAAILIFHCNHLFCATLLASVFTHALLCNRQRLARVLVLSLIVVLLSIPWLIWVSGTRYTSLYGFRFLNEKFFFFAGAYLRCVHYYIFPFFLLLIPLGKGIFLWAKYRNIKAIVSKDMFLWKNLVLLFLFIVFTILALSVASPLPFFRYLTQLIPVFCIVTAIIVTSAIRPYFRTAIAIIIVLLAVVFFADYLYGKTHLGREGIKYPNFFNYLDEITHDFDGPIEGIAKYLNEHGSEKDVVAITYGDLPLKFYTNMKVISGRTGEDISPAKEADWIIIRRNLIGDEDRNLALYLEQNVKGEYKQIEIDYSDIKWPSMPNPYWHKFRTVKNENKVIIHQKVK